MNDTMHPRLAAALYALTHLDYTLKPVQLGDQRKQALIEGLHGLAAQYGREIEHTDIDARGELRFVIKNNQGFGEDLAKVLSLVPRRYGVAPCASPAIAENGWCWINHFDAEKLLNTIGMALMDDVEQAVRP